MKWAIRKYLAYATISLVLCSCSPSRESLLEKAVGKIVKDDAPRFDDYPVSYNRMLVHINKRDAEDPRRIPEIYSLRAVCDGQAIDDTPDYEQGMDWAKRLSEKALVKSAEQFAREYFGETSATSALERIAEKKDSFGEYSIKPGFYHGEPSLKGIVKINNLCLGDFSFGEFKFELGTQGTKAELARPLGRDFYFVAEWNEKSNKSDASIGLVLRKRDAKNISDLYFLVVNDNFESSDEEDNSGFANDENSTRFMISYARIF